MSRLTKKYQLGGNLDAMSALRGLSQSQNIQEVLSKTGETEAGLALTEGIGKTTEKQEAEMKAAQEAIEAQQRKSKGLFKKLKFLDFIPGGKWLKTAVKGISAFSEADKMKDLMGGLNITGYGNSIFEKGQEGFNEQLKKMRKDISPFQALTQSIVGDVVSGKMGETFGEAFGGTKTGFEGDMPVSYDPAFGDAATPFKDQFKTQFGLGGGFDLKGGTGMNFLNMLGLGDPDAEGGLFQGDFFSPSNAQQGYNLFGGGGQNTPGGSTNWINQFLSSRQKGQ